MSIDKKKSLQTPIEYLKGVGPQRGELLNNELGIFTINDLIHHFPFRYIDRTKVYKVKDINQYTQDIQLLGKLSNIKVLGKPRQRRMTAVFSDDSGSIELIWFRGIKWIENYLKPGVEYLIFGKPGIFNRKYNITHPEMEVASKISSELQTGLQAVYSSTEKLRTRSLDSKGLIKLVKNAFQEIKQNEINENLPVDVIEKYRLLNRYSAYYYTHFPDSDKSLSAAKRRLIFEELFLLQLKILNLKIGRTKILNGIVFEQINDLFDRFFHNKLPFELTNAQKRVLREIRQDVRSGMQMNRLLQGDVGSGKTIVALMTMLMALDNKYQACIIAPTEILAQQHYKTINEQLDGLGIRTALLTGSIKGKARKEILAYLKTGTIQIMIGTHALLEDKVQFSNLGCVVIDEQHRFGVAQRARLWAKNVSPPHVLVMTATPIPRTLAMTLYGDLDASAIDELPPGRKPIRTIHKSDKNRLEVFGFLKKEIKLGRQVYIVYPLIEESEKLDYKDLQDGYESIRREFTPPQYKLSMLHGRMKPADKEMEMQRFVKGETNIMIATTVIEVGVNVPNASVMVIESSERFGLSQLHQLRGRVGRGADQSYCILMTGHKLSSDARLRTRTMVETNDGFKIAEVDLKLRGPGDIEGTRQSGLLDLKMADIARDQKILIEARKTAMEILEEDPKMELIKNRPLKAHLQQYMNLSEWSRIS